MRQVNGWKSRAATVGVALLVVAGCTPAPASQCPPPVTPTCETPPPVDVNAELAALSTAEHQLESALCKYQVRCGAIGASEEALCETQASAALDRLHVSAYLGIWYDAFAEEISGGKWSFDAQIAANCIAAVATAPCEGIDVGISCLAAFDGRVECNGACDGDEDCFGDAQCVPSSDAKCALRSCQAVLAMGAYCDEGGLCPPGSYCSFSLDQPHVCLPQAAAGELCDVGSPSCVCGQSCASSDGYVWRCTDGVAGVACETDAGCVSGLICGPSGCQAPGGLDEKCLRDHDCVSGLVCSNPLQGSDGKCASASPPHPPMEGEPCDTQPCAPGLFCFYNIFSSFCRSVAGPGESCSGDCAPGFSCVGVESDSNGKLIKNGVCAPWLDAGSTCDPSQTVGGCPSDMECGGGNTCVAVVGWLGDSCTDTNHCHLGLSCDPSTMKCAPALPLGAPCTPPASGQRDSCGAGNCDPMLHLCAFPTDAGSCG